LYAASNAAQPVPALRLLSDDGCAPGNFSRYDAPIVDAN
jgi:hypothetical protein